MSTTWDPTLYARFADHRARPFTDLLARVGAVDPVVVVDLGCGNGPLTLSLADRWPGARIVGVDHSPQMLAAARAADPTGRVAWVEADLEAWLPSSLGLPAGVVLSNAALQWVPDHLARIAAWIRELPPGGWFAMQVPGNFASPSHLLMRETATDHPAAERLLAALERPAVATPDAYLDVLTAGGLDADVWETTYLHVLDPDGAQANPVLEWVRGTGLRPVLDVLPDPAERGAFLADYDARLRAAYPRTHIGVVLPFRRLFAVGRRR